MQPRVDLAVSSDDADELGAALKRAGFDVRMRALADVPETDADVLVLAGDAPGALAKLRALRDDGPRPDTPVVLVGVPIGTTHRGGGPGFGAEVVLLAPADAMAVVRAVRELQTAPAITHSRPSGRPEPSPERTMQLQREAGESQDGAGPGTGTDPLRSVEHVPSKPPPPKPELTPTTRSEPGLLASPPIRPPKQVAPLSDALKKRLAAADRRVFPTREPLEIWLPGGQQSANELLPAEVLEPPELELDEPDEESLEGFTLVGVPLLHGHGSNAPSQLAEDGEAEPSTSPGTPTSMSRRPPPPGSVPSNLEAGRAKGDSRLPPASQVPPKTNRSSAGTGSAPGSTRPGSRSSDGHITGVQEARVRPEPGGALPWPEEDAVLGRVGADSSFRGKVSAGGIVRVLLRLDTLELDADIEIVDAAGEVLRLELRDGAIHELRGDAARRACAALSARGVVSLGAPASEAEAARALERCTQTGALRVLLRERALREAREAALTDALRSAHSWLVRPPPDSRGEPQEACLAGTLASQVVEAARRALGAAEVASMLGSVSLSRGPRLRALCARALLGRELVAWARTLSATHLGAAQAALADEPGAPGLLFALIAGDALLAEAASSPEALPDPGAAREVVERAHALAVEGDYFQLLGLSPEMAERPLRDRDVERAHRDRRARLEALPLDALGLGALETQRAAALRAVDEAASVLSVPRLREAYARALGRGFAAPRLATTASEH